MQRLIEEENMLAPSLQQFSLRVEMLPSYIPIRVAEKILFVGESVQMFENHNHSPSRAGSSSGCNERKIGYSTIALLHYEIDRYGFFRADTDLFSSALADDRHADTDFLEPIFGADAAFAPIILHHFTSEKLHNDDNECYKSQFKK